MKRGEWHERARQLAAAGHGTAEIARRLGVTPPAVWKALNPERAREIYRRDNARPERVVAKRRAANAARVLCEDCGRSLSPGSLWRSHHRCHPCWRVRVRAERLERGRRIEAMWLEGLSLREIAERFGWTVNHLGVEIVWLRGQGLDLPYRRPAGVDERRVAA